MNDDQIRKLKNAGASDLEIERLVIAGVVDNMGVSEDQAYIIANNTIKNALSKENKDKPVPANTIDPRTGGTMTLEDQQKNVAESENAFKEFAEKSEANAKLREAAFSSNDPAEIAKAVKSSEELQKAATKFADFIADSPLGEQGSMTQTGMERPLSPAEQAQWTMPTWVTESPSTLPPADDPFFKSLPSSPPKPANEKQNVRSTTGGLPQINPREYFAQAGMTPTAAAQTLISANLQNIAPIFQSPFKDYLNRQATQFGLFNPAAMREDEQGIQFLDYLRKGPQERSAENVWDQVQGILAGQYANNPAATAYLQDTYGFGDTSDTKAQERQMTLASNLLAQQINPLYRNSYKDIIERDFTRAQMQNPVWQGNPLAWAAYTQTGQMPKSMLTLSPTLEGSIRGALPKFTPDGSVLLPTALTAAQQYDAMKTTPGLTSQPSAPFNMGSQIDMSELSDFNMGMPSWLSGR